MAMPAKQKNKANLHLYIDANVLIDIEDTKSPNHTDSNDFMQAALASNNVTLYVSAVSIIFYAHTLLKFKTRKQIHDTIALIEHNYIIVPLTALAISEANNLHLKDFEDATQYFTALYQGNITHIVTSDRHFPHLNIPVVSPHQAIALIQE